MAVNLSLPEKLVPESIEYWDRMSGRRGFRSRDVVERVMTHPEMCKELRRVKRANGSFGYERIIRQHVVITVAAALQAKDQQALRIWINVILPAVGQRYIRFTILRLAEIRAYEEAIDMRAKNAAEQKRKIEKFRIKLEQCPANTEVKDIYDEVVSSFRKGA